MRAWDEIEEDGVARLPRPPLTTPPLPMEYFADMQAQLAGQWLIKRLLPAIAIVVLYGHPGSGKTFLALDWAFHIALGWEWQGRKVKQGLVVYVAAEGLSGLRNRVEAFKKHHSIDDAPFALIPTPIDMQAPDADVNKLIANIEAATAHYGMPVVAVFIDTISQTFGAGKENTDDMGTYIANCRRVAVKFECMVMPVHHRPKDAESEDPRGHSSLRGNIETLIIVEAGATKKAKVKKQKDGQEGETILFTLLPVELGLDEDGEPATSCIVEPAMVDLTPRQDPIARAIAKLGDNPRLALKQLDDVTAAFGIVPPDNIPADMINRMRVGKVVSLKAWSDRALSEAGTSSDKDPDTPRRTFTRSLKRLQGDGIVKVFEDWAWRTWA